MARTSKKATKVAEEVIANAADPKAAFRKAIAEAESKLDSQIVDGAGVVYTKKPDLRVGDCVVVLKKHECKDGAAHKFSYRIIARRTTKDGTVVSYHYDAFSNQEVAENSLVMIKKFAKQWDCDAVLNENTYEKVTEINGRTFEKIRYANYNKKLSHVEFAAVKAGK